MLAADPQPHEQAARFVDAPHAAGGGRDPLQPTGHMAGPAGLWLLRRYSLAEPDLARAAEDPQAVPTPGDLGQMRRQPLLLPDVLEPGPDHTVVDGYDMGDRSAVPLGVAGLPVLGEVLLPCDAFAGRVQQVHPRQGGVGRQSQQGQQRWHQVHCAGQPVHPCAGVLLRRELDQQGDAQFLRKQVAGVVPVPVLVELLPVVGADDQDGVLPQSAPLQGRDELRQEGVAVEYLPVVARLHVIHVLRRGAAAQGLPEGRAGEAFHLLQRAVVAGGEVLPVAVRRLVRGVRIVGEHPHEEGRRLLPVQPLDGVGHDLLPLHHALVCKHVEALVVVEAWAGDDGAGAEAPGAVACLPQHLRQRQKGPTQPVQPGQRAVLTGMQPRQVAGHRGLGPTRLAVGAGEDHCLPPEPLQEGAGPVLIAVQAQMVPPKGLDHVEHHVGPLG